MNVHDNLEFKRLAERVAALEAINGTAPQTAPPQYHEPTLEDAGELCNVSFAYSHSSANMDEAMLAKLKQLGFYRKVQP